MNLLEDLIKIDNIDKKTVGLVGLNDEFFSLYVNKLLNKQKKNILIVTPTLFEANLINNSLSTYTNNNYLFPMDDFLTSESIAISPDLKVTRLETINRTFDLQNKIIVTHLNGYLRYLPTKEKYQSSILNLIKNKEYKREKLIDDLISIGYKTETLVTKTGEIGIRGFVIDIFPIEFEHPIRIEYFGDEIDSIRIFDEDTQKTIEEIEEVKILPYTEFLTDNFNEEYQEKQKYLKK